VVAHEVLDLHAVLLKFFVGPEEEAVALVELEAVVFETLLLDGVRVALVVEYNFV
jgi:hypothetical protein